MRLGIAAVLLLAVLLSADTVYLGADSQAKVYANDVILMQGGVRPNLVAYYEHTWSGVQSRMCYSTSCRAVQSTLENGDHSSSAGGQWGSLLNWSSAPVRRSSSLIFAADLFYRLITSRC